MSAAAKLRLAGLAGRHLSKRQLDEAMQVMDGDGSGAVDVDEFIAWWEHGKILPAQGSRIFQRVSEQVERKVKNVRTIFRQFDENKDGTVSHHEFRVGLKNIGVDVSEAEFQELIRTVDEDNSGEIDYNEFAASGIIGGKLFAARTRCSGCRTRGELLEVRRRPESDWVFTYVTAILVTKLIQPPRPGWRRSASAPAVRSARLSWTRSGRESKWSPASRCPPASFEQTTLEAARRGTQGPDGTMAILRMYSITT